MQRRQSEKRRSSLTCGAIITSPINVQHSTTSVAPIVSPHFLLDVSVEEDEAGSVWSAYNESPCSSSSVASNSYGACSVNTTTYDTPDVLSATIVDANRTSKLESACEACGVCVCVCVCVCVRACACEGAQQTAQCKIINV